MLKVIQIFADGAEIAHKIQTRAFESILEKYQDYNTNPALESLETVREKINRANTTAYIFQYDNHHVGWVRVIEKPDKTYKISVLCVLPEYRNKGIAQEALKLIENNHSEAQKWVLSTILEEAGNCHLYEKLGYERIGDLYRVNENMTLARYEKNLVRP